MSTTEDTASPDHPSLTVGDLRAHISDLPDAVRILVVVRDQRNQVQHDAIVRGVSTDTGADAKPIIVLDVQGMS